MKMFDYFVSLGPGCPVAASMSKYGIRSFSGIFDWLVTVNFDWVLHYIETNFSDFFEEKELERYDEFEHHFREKKSDIKFIHDGDYENAYEREKEKYARRISKFLEIEKYKVCYIRSVQSREELQYIEDNANYIRSVIQKYNHGSEIVFLFDDDIYAPSFCFRNFKLPGIWSVDSREKLRSYFDGADDFLTFCYAHYSVKKLVENLLHDHNEEMKALLVAQRRYTTLTTLLRWEFKMGDLPDKVIIYGAGNIGKELYNKICDFTSVIYFVDRRLFGDQYKGVEIISPDQLVREDDVTIIVSAVYDFEYIQQCLSRKFPEKNIISLDEILNLTKQ